MLVLSAVVGKRPAPNHPKDVKALHKRLMEIGKIPCYRCDGTMDETLLKGIVSVQRHFMRNPDGVISPNRRTHKFLKAWKHNRIASGVLLPGRLREAWDWVDPLLPKGSYCTSGYRSAAAQRRILHRFFRGKYRGQIIRKYGQAAYDQANSDLRANEDRILQMVRGVGQAIAKPGRSPHQRGKAIDVGGPSSIDAKQVAVIKLVARAHPELFSGKVLKERNGCVHFEIR